MDIRLPNISGKTEWEQLSEMRSYLFYLANALSFALSEKGTATESTAQSAGIPSGIEAQNLFNSIKGLIVKSDAVYESFAERFEEDHAAVFTETDWMALALSDAEAEGYCRYRKKGDRVYVEFACSASAETVSVLPEGVRPDRECVFVCAGNEGFFRASVSMEGVISVSGDGTEGTVFGRTAYFIQ